MRVRDGEPLGEPNRRVLRHSVRRRAKLREETRGARSDEQAASAAQTNVLLELPDGSKQAFPAQRLSPPSDKLKLPIVDITKSVFGLAEYPAEYPLTAKDMKRIDEVYRRATMNLTTPPPSQHQSIRASQHHSDPTAQCTSHPVHSMHFFVFLCF